MSVGATLAIAVLAAWAIAASCYVFRVPRLHRVLSHLNWFRTFAHWTMFAASPDPRIRPGAFVIEYCDDASGEWITALDGHHWSPHSFLLSPRRILAARAHYLGQSFATVRRQGNESAMAAELRVRENIIATYLQRIAPLPAGRTRAVRIVKRFGRSAPDEEEFTWLFATRQKD